MRYNLGCALAVPAPNYTYRKIYCTHISWQCEPSNEFFSVITGRQTIPEIRTHTHEHTQSVKSTEETKTKRKPKTKVGMKCNRIKRALIRKTEPNPEANPCGPQYKYYVCVFLCSFLWPAIEFYFPCVFIIAQIRRTWKWGNGNENKNVSASASTTTHNADCQTEGWRWQGTFINYEWLLFFL